MKLKVISFDGIAFITSGMYSCLPYTEIVVAKCWHSQYFLFLFFNNITVFDKYKKEEGGEMTEERPAVVPDEVQTQQSEASSGIGIGELMGKRAKLEEAIDYVGLMIKNLKDKRTGLEKEIEDESVDIKNLKEKLQKISEYIDEENRGIRDLTEKRQQVESEADEVGTMINSLRDRLSGIDRIVEEEGGRVKRIKESREPLES